VVYEIGGLYFVRDGNHRVSVAKDQGIAFIDAEVSSIGNDLALSPDMSTSHMLKAIEAHDRDRFFAATGLPIALQNAELHFGREVRYDILIADIERHLRYLTDEAGLEPTFPQATQSWLKDIYLPFSELARQLGATAPRRKTQAADLYVQWVRYEEQVERERSACAMPEDFFYRNLAVR
jgi:hypothetical protein